MTLEPSDETQESRYLLRKFATAAAQRHNAVCEHHGFLTVIRFSEYVASVSVHNNGKSAELEQVKLSVYERLSVTRATGDQVVFSMDSSGLTGWEHREEKVHRSYTWTERSVRSAMIQHIVARAEELNAVIKTYNEAQAAKKAAKAAEEAADLLASAGLGV